MKLKSSLKKLCPPHEAMLRHKVTFKEKANPDNPKHVANLTKKLDKEKAKVNSGLELIKGLLKENKALMDERTEVSEMMDSVLEGAVKEYENKEDYFKYQSIVKRS